MTEDFDFEWVGDIYMAELIKKHIPGDCKQCKSAGVLMEPWRFVCSHCGNTWELEKARIAQGRLQRKSREAGPLPITLLKFLSDLRN